MIGIPADDDIFVLNSSPDFLENLVGKTDEIFRNRTNLNPVTFKYFGGGEVESS